jgi:hypothetical protein
MWGAKGNERHELRSFAKALSRMDDRQRRPLLAMAQRMAGHNPTMRRTLKYPHQKRVHRQ